MPGDAPASRGDARIDSRAGIPYAPRVAVPLVNNMNLTLANATFFGEGELALAGSSVAGVGDVNNDGFDDFVIGASDQDTAIGEKSGKAYLFFGNASSTFDGYLNLSKANASFVGESYFSYAGCAVAGAGDVNNDGFDDILIGASNASTGGKYSGKAYLIYGNVTDKFYQDMNLSQANASFCGEWNYDYFGASLAGAGDVNGDGYDDILIGAPLYNLVATKAGKAYLFYGNSTDSGTLGLNIDGALANASFYEVAAMQRFGTSVAGVGDINKDGYEDLLFGAPYNPEAGPSGGKAYIMYGNVTGTLRPMMRMDKLANVSFIAEAENNWLGMGVAGVGDVNNDGINDFLVGAQYHSNGTKLANGASYLFFGNDTPGVFSANMSVGLANATFFGEANNDQSGRVVAGAGDVNRDGYSDFLIGSKKDLGGGQNGKTYLILGNATAVILGNHSLTNSNASFCGINGIDDSGNSLAGAGDINGDGYADLLIASHYNNYGAFQAGAAYLIWGPDVIAPAAIADLTPSSPTTHHMTLTWTAPGDDGMAGNVSSYILKYSLTPITAGNFNAATTFATTGPYAANGTQELQVVTTLLENKQYYFAVKAVDDWNNTGPISNVAQFSTINLAPAAVLDLQVIAATTTSVTINWTAPGDDGPLGNVTGYSVKYSKYPITLANYTEATTYNTASWDNFVEAGQIEVRTITGLVENTYYYFAIKGIDDALNYGGISNVPYNKTGSVPPAAVANLALTNPTMVGFTLTWTAPGDDGMAGNVSGYVVKYSNLPITAGNFDAATTFVQAWEQLSPGGALESRVVMGLVTGMPYYFAIKAFDAAGNLAAISNVPSEYTLNDTFLPSLTAPQDIAYEVGATGASITWTITDSTVTAPTYKVYRGSDILIADQPWVSGTPVVIPVSGLAAGVYSFTIVANDGYGHLVADEVAVTVTTPAADEPGFPFTETIAVLAIAAVVLVLVTRFRKPKAPVTVGKREVPSDISSAGKKGAPPAPALEKKEEAGKEMPETAKEAGGKVPEIKKDAGKQA